MTTASKVLKLTASDRKRDQIEASDLQTDRLTEWFLVLHVAAKNKKKIIKIQISCCVSYAVDLQIGKVFFGLFLLMQAIDWTKII